MKEMRNHFSRTAGFTLLLTGFLIGAYAQEPKPPGLVPDKWATVLAKDGFDEANPLGSLTKMILALDSVRTIRVLDSIENSKNAKGYMFKAKFCMVKADVLFKKYASYDKFKDRGSITLKPIREQLTKLYEEALDAANHTDNDLIIGWVNFYSAQKMIQFGDIAWGVMYSKNGVDIFEKVKYPIEPPVYTDLAELLCKVREYDESILYAKKGLAAWKTMNYEKDYDHPYKFKIRAFNAIGRWH